jgi:predicted nucleotidyltransferase
MLAGLTRAGVRFVVIGGLAARAHGSPRITEDLDICYDRAPENVRRLAKLLEAWKAYPRGIESGLPFIMDAKTLTATPIMTLVTDRGYLDIFDEVPGLGGYERVLAASVEVEADELSFQALDLPALILSKRATGRPRDREQIPELEALLELRRRRRS